MFEKGTVARLLIVVAAATGTFAPLPSGWVEQWYSSGVYPFFQSLRTSASNAVPFALLDLLIAITVMLFLARCRLDVLAHSRLRATWRILRRLLVWSAAFYIVFLAAWGLNYRRVPLDRRRAFDRHAVTPDAAALLASITVERLNALHARAHAEGIGASSTIDPTMAGAFDQVARILSADNRFVAGRPKWSILDFYFLRAGVSGMTDPYFLEILIAADLLPFERPFVVAHEWSHLGGLADEGEANLAGWLICLRGSAAHQYSGWLFMYSEALRAAPPGSRQETAARLATGPRDDLRAIRDRVARQVSPLMSAAGWRVYDSYLKANRVEAGALSYDEVVRLALGLQIAQDAIGSLK